MHPGGVSLADAALLREFIQHVPAAVAMFDRQMRYIFVSERWMEDYRLGDQEIIGRTHYEVFPEIPERWKELHRRALAGEVVRCDEDRFERADGTVDWVRWEIRPWYTISGKVGGVTMFTEVITERKHVEDAIRASETRFRILSTSAPIGIFELDAEGRCQYVNTRWEAITGRTSEEGLGYGWHQTIHPEDREWLLQEARERIRAGFPGEREFRILRPDGSVRWVRVHVAPMVDPQAGRPSGFVGTLDDITAEKEAEEKLQASEQRFMALVNSNIVGIVLGDMSGRIYKANDAFLKMAGYTRADLAAGKVRWSLLTSPESAPEDQRALAELQEKGTAGPWEKEYTRKDGSRVPVLIGLARLGATGSQTIGFVLDLSERKRAEGALRLIAQASRVLASSPDFPDAVNRIAHLLVPTLGDWCVIHVLDEEGNVQRAAVAAAAPAQASLARQWMEAPPPAPEAIQPPPSTVAQSGRGLRTTLRAKPATGRCANAW
ncbi:MAG TPA: PAS domain S-box protein [Armatimonadota bacterium]|nr:PAS domain S-box protein [Armatimonadota bacterium]